MHNVSVPLRGNRRERSRILDALPEAAEFPSPCGVIGVKAVPPILRQLEPAPVSVPLRGNRRESSPENLLEVVVIKSFRPLAG